MLSLAFSLFAAVVVGRNIDLDVQVSARVFRERAPNSAVELRAWKNERVSARFAIRGDAVELGATGFVAGNSASIPASAVEARIIGATEDKDGRKTVTALFTVAVPADAGEGVYSGSFFATAKDAARIEFPVVLKVLDAVLPAVSDAKTKKDCSDLLRFGASALSRIRWTGQYAAAKRLDGFASQVESMLAEGKIACALERELWRDSAENWSKIRILRKDGKASDALEAALAMHSLKAMERADEESFRESVALVEGELNRMEGDAELPLALAGWVGGRRARTLDWFRREMYGYAPGRPDDMVFDDKGVTFAGGKMRINIHVSLPEGASEDNPAPAFVMGDHYYHRTSRTKTDTMPNMPTNTITGRGYAYVRVNYNDVALNCYNSEWSNKVHSVYGVGRDDDWGTISAWAWCLSRVMDWIETRPELDAGRVAVTGHSRGGKAALWAAAQDRRFAMAAPNGSGTGGARLMRIDLPKAEPLDWMLNASIKFWFCPNLQKFRGRTDELPYDADDLIRLVAPRLAYVGSGSKDDWAGPQGEFEAARRAGDIWELYGKKSLSGCEFPRPGEWLHDASVGYHLHDGPHALRKWDWERFMDFADRHLRKPGDMPAAALDPIGVFDSGVGGMTVLEQMLKMDLYDNETGERRSDGRADLEGERFVYFGDQANMPYGDYAAAGKSDYLKKLIVDDAGFLLSKKAKAVVIACNTATAWGLPLVAERARQADAASIGVIGAGVACALSLPEIARAEGAVSIGVMATPGTIASGAYERTIRQEAKKRGIKARITVISQGCAGLADAVEAGSPTANEIACANYRELTARHAAVPGAGAVKAVILGCTHYPFVLPALRQAAGGDVIFVDPALATAEECYLALRDSGRLRKRGVTSLSAFISIPSPKLGKAFLDEKGDISRKYKYGREIGDRTRWTEVKHYSALDAQNNGFIKESLPATWQLLYGTTYFPRK